MCPSACNSTKGWANHLSHPLSSTPGHIPTLISCKALACPYRASKPANLLLICSWAQSLSSVQLFVTLCDCSPPGSSVYGIFWSGLPFPTPGDLPNPGNELVSPGRLSTTVPPGKPAQEPARKALAEHLVWSLVNFC